jgi:hypothetical protein
LSSVCRIIFVDDSKKNKLEKTLNVYKALIINITMMFYFLIFTFSSIIL